MRRTPLKRGTKGLARRTRLKAKGGSRFPKRRDPEYCAWIRTLECIVVGLGDWIDGGRECAGRIECAHMVTRAAGGFDRGDTLPLCTRHHRQQHSGGIKTFGAIYQLDLHLAAFLLERRYAAARPHERDQPRPLRSGDADPA